MVGGDGEPEGEGSANSEAEGCVAAAAVEGVGEDSGPPSAGGALSVEFAGGGGGEAASGNGVVEAGVTATPHADNEGGEVGVSERAADGAPVAPKDAEDGGCGGSREHVVKASASVTDVSSAKNPAHDGGEVQSGAASASLGDELRHVAAKARTGGGDSSGGISVRALLGKPLKSGTSSAPKTSTSVHKNGKPTHEYNIYSFFKATTPVPRCLPSTLPSSSSAAAAAPDFPDAGVSGIGRLSRPGSGSSGDDAAPSVPSFRLQELWDWFDQPYGVEVPIVLKNIYYSVKSQTNADGEVPAFYVPHLSAMVLFPREGAPPKAPKAGRGGKASAKPVIDVGAAQAEAPGVGAVTGGGAVRAWGKKAPVSWAAITSKNPPPPEGEGASKAGGGAGGGAGAVQTGVGAWGRPGAWESTLYWNQAWNSKPVTPPANSADKGTWANKVAAPKGSWVDVVSKEGAKEAAAAEDKRKEEKAWGIGGQAWGDMSKDKAGAGGEAACEEGKEKKEVKEGAKEGSKEGGSKEVKAGGEEGKEEGKDGKIPKISQRAANYIDDILKSSGVIHPSTPATSSSETPPPPSSSLPPCSSSGSGLPPLPPVIVERGVRDDPVKEELPPAEPEFEFYETRPPGERPPLWDCVHELAEGLVLEGVDYAEPRLLSGRNTDFDTGKSWVAVAWYPILCHATTAHAIKGSFITYHRLLYLQETPVDKEADSLKSSRCASTASHDSAHGGFSTRFASSTAPHDSAQGVTGAPAGAAGRVGVGGLGGVGEGGLAGLVKGVVGSMVAEASRQFGEAAAGGGKGKVVLAEDGTVLGEALPLEMSGYVHYKVVNVTWYAPRNRPGGMSSASNFVVPVYLFELAAVFSRTFCGSGRGEDGEGCEATVVRKGPHRDFEHIMAKFTNFETVLDLLSKQRQEGKEGAGVGGKGGGKKGGKKGGGGGGGKSPRGGSGGRKLSAKLGGPEGAAAAAGTAGRKTRSMPGSPSQKPRSKRPSNSPQIGPEPAPAGASGEAGRTLTRGVSLDR